MAIQIKATCSECYGDQDLSLNSKDKEIECPVCGHSVPNFEADDFDRIQYHQEKQKKSTIFSCAAFGIGVVLFIIFLNVSEPAEGAEPNQMVGMLLGVMILAALVVSIWQGISASARRIIAEF